MRYSYRPRGVCSRQIDLEVEDGIIKDIQFIGGCSGNTKGVSALCRGRKVQDVIDLLRGTTCGMKDTSCPDQLARALSQMQEKA